MRGKILVQFSLSLRALGLEGRALFRREALKYGVEVDDAGGSVLIA